MIFVHQVLTKDSVTVSVDAVVYYRYHIVVSPTSFLLLDLSVFFVKIKDWSREIIFDNPFSPPQSFKRDGESRFKTSSVQKFKYIYINYMYIQINMKTVVSILKLVWGV